MSILAGLSLGVAGRARSARSARITAVTSAVALCVLAVTALLQRGLRLELGVESLFYDGSLTSWPYGIPRTQAALAFLLLGAALWLLQDRRRLADYLALFAATMAASTLLGYLFDVTDLGGWPSLFSSIGMSLPVALVVLALAIGMLTFDVDNGVLAVVVARDAGGTAARQMLLGVALFLPTALLIMIGTRVGWYELPIAAALVVLVAIAQSTSFILRTARRLSRVDAATKRAAEALQQSETRERQLRAELEALAAATTDITKSLLALGTSSTDTVFEKIAEQARSLTGATYATVAIGSDGDGGFKHCVASGIDRTAPGVCSPCRDPSGAGQIVRQPDMLAVPIRHQQNVIGELFLGPKQDAGEFSETDERMIEMLAEPAAVAIEIARIYAAEANQRAWLQSTIDQLPEGVLLLDAQGVVKAMNRALLMWTTGDTGNVDPWGNRALFDMRDVDGAPLPFEKVPIVKALTSGEPTLEEEMLVRQPNDRMLPIAARAAPVRDDEGRITGAVAIARDITERKELERLREEWIAVITHDLRQPINTILLYSDLLARKHTEPVAESYVQKVRDAGWRLNRMAADLLDVARLAANQLTVDQRVVDIVEITSRVLDGMRLSRPDATIELEAPARQLVLVDIDRIQQVLENLVSNALKYGDAATPIRVRITPDHGHVTIAVINTGSPIPPDELARLFARFSRTREARTSGKPGIGLGLYICKGLIEANGGRIWAESDAESTRFMFTLREPATM